MADERLLVARELVAELQRMGVGTWSPDAVRQWIREEPACPIAERGRRGQSHLYRIADVLLWLRARDTQAALKQGVEPQDVASAGVGASPHAVGQATVTPTQAIRAQAAALQGGDMELVQRMLEVLEGRDPRTWKAAEEALATRLKRQESQRQLVASSELDLCLSAQQTAFLSAVKQMKAQLKLAIRNVGALELMPVIDADFDKVIERLSAEPERFLEDQAA